MKNNDNNIKFIGIANMIDKNIIIEYSQPGPNEKKSSVYNNLNSVSISS
jgi:hypothetical protein